MDRDCIHHWGSISNSGYGLTYDPKTQKTTSAHRKTYYDFFGEIPKGKVIKHLCNNKVCVNPLHLKADSQSENIKDSYKDGLQINPHRSQTSENVIAIFNAIGSQREIARKFKTSQTVVKNIRNRVTYRDLTGGGTCGS